MSETSPPTESTLHNHPSGTRVTTDEIRRVANLANLELTAEELPGIERDLNAVLDYIAQLNRLDTTGIAPMAQVGELLASVAHPATESERASSDGEGHTLRADRSRPSIARSLVLAAAPETDGAFFKVPRVIER